MLGAGRGYAVFEAGRIHNGWYVVLRLRWRRCEIQKGGALVLCAVAERSSRVAAFQFRILCGEESS